MTRYKQVKISVNPELVETFKAACVEAGVYMASELSRFMEDRTPALVRMAVKQANMDRYDTRAKRRRQINIIISQMENIMEHENTYKENIPENLRSGLAYENAERTVKIL